MTRWPVVLLAGLVFQPQVFQPEVFQPQVFRPEVYGQQPQQQPQQQQPWQIDISAANPPPYDDYLHALLWHQRMDGPQYDQTFDDAR